VFFWCGEEVKEEEIEEDKGEDEDEEWFMWEQEFHGFNCELIKWYGSTNLVDSNILVKDFSN
jgi:hypothetical protein